MLNISFDAAIAAASENGLIFQELTYYGTPPMFVARVCDIRNVSGGWPTYFTSDRCPFPAQALKNACAKARPAKVVEDYSDIV